MRGWRPRRPRIAGPSPTIRLRLTVLYGLVFLVTGAVLLTVDVAQPGQRDGFERRHHAAAVIMRALAHVP